MTTSMGIYERHGHRGTKIYGIWSSMKSRCLNANDRAYRNYGGRGVTVCDQWKKFSNFLSDMGEAAPHMTLERIDNSRGYSPDNCRWATRTEQGCNKRNNVILTIGDVSKPLSKWAEQYGLKYQTIHQRLHAGWTPEDAVKTPLVTRRRGIPRGQKLHNTDPTTRKDLEDAA